MRVTCGHMVLVYVLLYVCPVCLAVNCVIHVVWVLFVCVHLLQKCVVCAHGVCVGVNTLTPLCQVRTRSHPILDYLPKVQSPYCILISDITFSLFLFCSSLFTFLRISTEMWQRINLFIQRALSLCLLLAHFSLLILKWNYALRLEQCTSTNTADLTEGGQERWRYSIFQSWDQQPNFDGLKEERWLRPSSGQWRSLIPQVSLQKHKKGHINSGKCAGVQRLGSSSWVVVTVLHNVSTSGPQFLSICRKRSLTATSVPMNITPIFI